MPRITGHTTRRIVFYVGSALLICAALTALWLAAQIEARMIRQENTISVPDDRSPKLEQALRSMADSWREENRNR